MKRQHKQTSARWHQGILGALNHQYFVINMAVLPVQLRLCGGLSVDYRLIPLGSYVEAAGMRGQKNVGHQLASWWLW